MRAIIVMFDSLCRHLLQPYGCDWTRTPNFQRLAQRCCAFDRCYVGSMPCMPARRELHTGRYNFLHRGWGPLEPFDDSMPRLLSKAGVYTHLVTDHYHYFEAGGATYHSAYDSWEFVRGQEGDPWMGQVADPEIPPAVDAGIRAKQRLWRQDWVNRGFLRREEDMPQARTFAAGLDFIRRNAGEQNWLLQLETFDPHEPFFAQEHWQRLYPHRYAGLHFDWPSYRAVEQPPDAVEHIRCQYAALLSMCDHYLGQVLDLMDSLRLWDDTLLVVCTDHGFLLGEHECWAKCWCPFYEEVAHVPLFVWDPRSRVAGERRSALVQTIDLPATLLEFFGQPLPEHMEGRPLRAAVERDERIRDVALFGMLGGYVNATDGRYVYLRGPADRARNAPLHEYTLMPCRMRDMFSVADCARAELHPGFAFTKGAPVLRIPGGARFPADAFETLLYDLERDPCQRSPIRDEAVERRMIDLMVARMQANEAPEEQYQRLGLEAAAGVRAGGAG